MPSKLSPANKSSHLMSVDKIVAQFKIIDLCLLTEDEVKKRNLFKLTTKSDYLFVSDFDDYMSNRNPIV